MVEFGVGDSKLVELPQGKTSLDRKVVFRCKINHDGNVVQYKHRSKVKGFTQHPRNNSETYSSMAMLVTVRLVLAFATIHGWPMHVVNINNAFVLKFQSKHPILTCVQLTRLSLLNFKSYVACIDVIEGYI